MPNTLVINRTYEDDDILFRADLNNIATSIENFVNTVKLNEDNIDPTLIAQLVEPGLIMLYGAETPPAGWLSCDGSEVSQATYAALYAVVGSTYNTGGEGVGNFRLPDYSRRAPVGVGGSGTGVLGNSLGNIGGEETHTLASDRSTIPAHTHTDSTGHAHLERGTASGAGSGAIELDIFDSINETTTGETTGSATPVYNAVGSGGAHNNMQPSLVMHFIIKV